MKVLVIGLGQDAVLMAKLLKKNGTDFRVMARRSSGSVSKFHSGNIEKDVLIPISEVTTLDLIKLKKAYDFTHIFNFAANSFVQDSSTHYSLFIKQNSEILWSILGFMDLHKDVWLFHPLSSEILFRSPSLKLGINGCIQPMNAYGLAKTAEHFSCEINRRLRSGRIHSCVLFNHESKYRPPQFFTQKAITFFQEQKQKSELTIYNAKSQRDWGSAEEYMQFLFESAEREVNDLTLLGTGEALTVEAFIDNCFEISGIEFEKRERDHLLQWRSSKLTVTELHRDPLDSKRKVIADKQLVRSKFLKTPQINGVLLIKKLLNDEI